MSQDARKCPFLKKNRKNRKSSRSLSKIHPEKQCLFTPIERQKEKRKRAFSGILKKGSLTVEAAFAVPLFMLSVICISSLMGVYSGTLEKMAALRDTCEATALAASAIEDEMWIDLSAPQDFQPYFIPAGVTFGNVICKGRARCWNGRDPSRQGTTYDADAHTYVYVSEYASVYHTSSSCTHLQLSIQAVSKAIVFMYRNAGGAKYSECELCASETGDAELVYITEDGTKFHKTTACSGLKRTVKMVDMAEVDSLGECSRCGSHT